MSALRTIRLVLAFVAALFGGVVTMWCCTPAVTGPTMAAACPMEEACCAGGSRTTTSPSCVIGPTQEASASIISGVPAHIGVTAIATAVGRPYSAITFGTFLRAPLALLSAATVQLRI
jgi:hypothetical protein